MSLWLLFGDQETISKFHLHPLGKFMDDYAKWLYDKGYCWEAARVKIRNVARQPLAQAPWHSGERLALGAHTRLIANEGKEKPTVQ
jgi:hypothetical protein